MGESISLVGSTPELGLWDHTQCIRLYPNAESYPLWWTDPEIDLPLVYPSGEHPWVEYKYVRLTSNGTVTWESPGLNRWLSIDPGDQFGLIIVDDGVFGYPQPYPFGYLEPIASDKSSEGLKILIIGSSIALSDKAWLLGQALQQKYGHQLVNKLEKHCPGKSFHLLLLSPQASDEFLDLSRVLHFNQNFNPDRMYENLGYWMYCTEVMRGILESLGVSSQNLFWCPPQLP